MANTKTAVTYCRYSSHGQTEQSIEGQLRVNYEYAEREGYTIVADYIDRGISGRTDDRPEFQRMLDDSAKQNCDTVLVWKLDRFARNRYDSAIYKAKLKKNGVRVVSCTERISDTPEGVILESVLEGFAEYYSASLSQNVKRGNRETLMKGNYLGGIAPIGYKIVDKKLVENPETSWIIKTMFRQYADGVPVKEIMAALEAQGVRNAYGKPLSLSAMQNALKNQKYIGIYQVGDFLAPYELPALIDIETFNRAQDRRKAFAHAPGAKPDTYLLQGKAFCGHCNAALVGVSGYNPAGVKYNYYACRVKHKFHTCDKKNEKQQFLEDYVIDMITRHILNPKKFDALSAEIADKCQRELDDSSLRDLERKIAVVQRDINAAVDASLLVTGEAQQPYFDKINRLVLQKKDFEVDLSRLEAARPLRLTSEQIKLWMRQFLGGNRDDPEFRRKIIDILLCNLYVYDDKLLIYFNIHGNVPAKKPTEPRKSLKDGGAVVPSPVPVVLQPNDVRTLSRPPRPAPP
jgi:DNA invertase Pin-like site-specific DNA recombinase